MILKKSLIILSIISFLFSHSLFAGGGWPKKKGTFYIKLSGWYLESDRAFGQRNNIKSDITTSGLFNLNVYGEYGITDKLTAIASIPFYYKAYINKNVTRNTVTGEETTNPFSPGVENSSFGDTQLGFKYGLFKNDLFSISASYIIDIPLGDRGGIVPGEEIPNSGGQLSEVTIPATGDGELNHIFRGDVGISIYNSDNFSLYGNVYGGVNIRSKDFSEEVRLGGEIGAGFLQNKLFVVGKIDTIQSLNNGDRIVGEGNGIFVNNIEITSISPEISYKIYKNIGISAGASVPLAGKFVFSDPSYTAGIFIDVK